MSCRTLIFTLILGVYSTHAALILSRNYPESDSESNGSSEGSLFLTPYIESDRIDEGRKAARVPPLKGDIESYSGFFTVDKKFNSNMFFWFFPAEINPSEAPVVAWLQGGPGSSSLFGLFSENGPYSVTKQGTLEKRDIYWSRELNVIYIDNPVGTGFSFTQDDAGYATNETTVGINLYQTLVQFFQLFPQYQKNKFFLTGESYAGKYIPAAAFTIHKNNPSARIKINLEGIAIGNGWCDPENQLNYGDYLYELGLIDNKSREWFTKKKNDTASLIKNGTFINASGLMENMLDHFGVVTGIGNAYNYVTNVSTQEIFFEIQTFLKKKEVKEYLHVGNVAFDLGAKVSFMLVADLMQSIKPWLEEIMNNYRVLLYNGQLDVIVAYPLTVDMIKNLSWNGKSDYEKATRQKWITSKNEVAGYFKTGGNFTEVLVRNAGHMVPSDQPEWAFDLIKRFTQNTSLTNSH